jgi:enamine deaminase RidA (YjgF/YER057c/UK114 family)
LRAYKARQPVDFFCSQTEQPPAAGVKLAMLGLCLSRVTSRSRRDDVLVLDTPIGVRHVFAGHLTDPGADEHRTAEQQMTAIFHQLQDKLAAMSTTLPESVLRTWIYAPHLDADYPGIVKARNNVFDAVNLTKHTHFIASTGIQGGTDNRFVRVFMDAYALVGPGRGPTRYIHAPEFLPPAHQYGVAFERATAVVIQGTEFLFISGTASIDKDGSIVHPGDVVGQTERTLRNIDALLQAAGFDRRDLGSFIVYLRDATDYRFVRPLIDAYAPNLPTVYVKAAVCRPGWLIEIEATAARLCGHAQEPGPP